MDRIFVIQKRKLSVKEVLISDSTIIFAKDIGEYVFFDKKSANDRLLELLEAENKKQRRNKRCVN